MPIDLAWLHAPLHRLDVWTDHLGEPLKLGRLTYEVDPNAGFFQYSMRR